MAFDFSSVVIGTPDASQLKRRGGGGGGRDSKFINGFRNLLNSVPVGAGLVSQDPFEIIGLDIDHHETDEDGKIYVLDSKGKRVTFDTAVNRIRSNLSRKGALPFRVTINTNLDGSINILRGEDISVEADAENA